MTRRRPVLTAALFVGLVGAVGWVTSFAFRAQAAIKTPVLGAWCIYTDAAGIENPAVVLMETTRRGYGDMDAHLIVFLRPVSIVDGAPVEVVAQTDVPYDRDPPYANDSWRWRRKPENDFDP